MTDYQPIDCGFHDEFELAIMHNKYLHISWQLPGSAKQTMQLKPLDLITKNHEEFLLAEHEDENGINEKIEIRLDYIIEVQESKSG